MESVLKERGQDNTVTELILDGHKFKEITSDDAKLLEGFSALTTLSCNQTGLKSLENFPKLASLESLELTDNMLSAQSSLEALAGCPNLRVLYLSGNKFKSVDELKPLSALSKLERLDLELNPMAEVDGYRDSVFGLFPAMKVVDDKNREGEDVEPEAEKDEEEDDDDEDTEATAGEKFSLKEFYEKDIMEDDDDEDDYQPNEEESDEEDDDDEEYAEEPPVTDDTDPVEPCPTKRRPISASSGAAKDDASKQQKVDGTA